MGYLTSTMNPCRANTVRAGALRRKARTGVADAEAPAVSAAGYRIGGCVPSGNVSTVITPGSASASVRYTMPSGASPRDTSNKAARTSAAGASFDATDDQTPSDVSAACAYSPPGTDVGSPTASRPAPNRAASANPGAIFSVTGWWAGAMSTSVLPSTFTRESALMR